MCKVYKVRWTMDAAAEYEEAVVWLQDLEKLTITQ